jgi:hypothetical protein
VGLLASGLGKGLTLPSPCTVRAERGEWRYLEVYIHTAGGVSILLCIYKHIISAVIDKELLTFIHTCN